MKISGSETRKFQSMSQNLLRMEEERTIQYTTAALSQQGKHVINIIHGTPSALMGTIYQSLTFLWEADDEDPVYKEAKKRAEQAEEMITKIESCKTDIEKLKNRITVAGSAYADNVAALHKEEKVDYEKEYKEHIRGSIFGGVASVAISLTFFWLAVACSEYSGLGGIICGCVGVLFLVIAGASFSEVKDSGKDSSFEEFKRLRESSSKSYENEKATILADRANLSGLRTELKGKEKELARLEAELRKL